MNAIHIGMIYIIHRYLYSQVLWLIYEEEIECFQNKFSKFQDAIAHTKDMLLQFYGTDVRYKKISKSRSINSRRNQDMMLRLTETQLRHCPCSHQQEVATPTGTALLISRFCDMQRLSHLSNLLLLSNTGQSVHQSLVNCQENTIHIKQM